jgi:sodium transport system permease protein
VLRMHIVGTVFRKELREMLRDRRSLLIMFGVPLVLYPVLTVALGRLAQSQEAKLKEEAASVVVRNAADAPGLVARLNADGSGLRVLGPLPDPTATQPAIGPATRPTPATASAPAPAATSSASAPLTAPATSPVAPSKLDPASPELEAGTVDAVLTIPPSAEARALAGEQPEFVVGVNRGRFRAAVSVERKIEKVLREYERWVVERRLGERGVPPAVLAPLKTRTVDVATGGQRLGSLMATMLPLFLLITGTLGALFPAINATTTERERGTLETLLASPAGRTEILLGKGLLVLLGGLVTAGLNVASMAMVLRWLFAGIGAGGAIAGGAGGGGGAGALADLAIDPAALGLAYLAAVPTLVFVAALVMVAGLFARTFQEANSLSLPVMLLPLASAAIAVADPPTTAGLLVTPIANTTVLIRDLLTGRATIGAFLLASAASCLYAGLLVSAAARLFNTEQLVNPAWEPLKFRGFGRRAKKPRVPRPPSVDAALALFAVTLLLVLYSAPALAKLPVRPDLQLLAIVVVTMLGLIAAPALLLAWLAGYPWVETFSLRRPSWPALAGGALVGVGLVPLVNLLYVLQSAIWPASADTSAAAMRMFLPSVAAHPVLTAVTVGALAGLCEELLYRGPIQAALTRRLPVTFGLFVTAALFSAAHMDAHGFPLRLLLGLVLGYVVLRGGSIFPAMLLHAMYDATQMAEMAWFVHTQGAAKTAEQAVQPSLESLDAAFWLTFAVGTVLLVIGTWLFRRAWRRPAAVDLRRDVEVLPAP